MVENINSQAVTWLSANSFKTTIVIGACHDIAIYLCRVSGHTLLRDSRTRGAAEHVAKLRTAGLSTAIELPDPPTLAAFGIDHFQNVIDSAGFDLVFANTAEAAALGIGQSGCLTTAPVL
jgi:hypothetical protein